MSRLIRNYLKYTRGESKYSPWSLLYPTQFITRAWMKLRIELYKSGIFSGMDPVLPGVSIGNNCFGGTNKTPMTELVVRQFMEAGIEAGLVSRGYRTKKHPPLWVGQNEDSLKREIAGDEPLMLAKRLPNVRIVVAKNRVKGVELLASLGVQVAVTDDTFQHRKMSRDVDIVLVDSTCPFGNRQVIPAGSMREPMSAFSRADMVVLTKANQVDKEQIVSIKKELEPWVELDRVFVAEINLESWMLFDGDEVKDLSSDIVPKGRYIAFSAIGNPPGFYDFIRDKNVDVVACRTFRDHHIFTEENIRNLEKDAEELGADGFICTEKDVVNLPEELSMKLPLYVPRIAVVLDDDMRFRQRLHAKLRPRLIVASNGYGEDAIGVVLAKKIQSRFKCAKVTAFAFVGSGRHYSSEGIDVVSPSTDMPSGGVIKYSLTDLFKDIRHGLGNAIRSQLDRLHEMMYVYRTPVCVGDVYLMMNMLWGQGMKPILVATAKSVRLHGHLKIEEWLLRKRSRFVWTRDAETAEELKNAGVNARFDGNPVMDLIEDVRDDSSVWTGTGAKIVLLPGSRPRAYEDIKLILNSALELSKRVECQFVIVPAVTIDIDKMISVLDGWDFSPDGKYIAHGEVKIAVYVGQVAAVARKAKLLVGLGGTANQLCAGLGVPVVSIIETGKLRQKKLLKEAEILVEADPVKLAEAAENILTTPELFKEMSEAGVRYLGGTGALDSVVEYCATVLGWDNRCYVYEKYGEYLKEMSADKKGADKL
ncbi:MAG: tetraacyldisaccharide 4'-kinase [Synergistaceae bacterium]|nr:tetraacyldisaccharide 4'-kinase [Synergistaceae bacterium]